MFVLQQIINSHFYFPHLFQSPTFSHFYFPTFSISHLFPLLLSHLFNLPLLLSPSFLISHLYFSQLFSSPTFTFPTFFNLPPFPTFTSQPESCVSLFQLLSARPATLAVTSFIIPSCWSLAQESLTISHCQFHICFTISALFVAVITVQMVSQVGEIEDLGF